YWLLLPLMLLALFAFRRGGAFAAVLLCVLLPLAMPTTAHAAEIDWWQRADQRQHARIEQAADAYRKGNFAAAEQALKGIDNADALYNLGNALAKQGRYDEAIAAYDKALKQQPAMEDAIENRKVVDAARKRKQQGGQNQKQPGKGEPGKSQQSPGQGQQNPGQDQQQGKPQPPDASKKTSPGNTAPPPKPQVPQAAQNPADAKAQQSADAAQRQRMQQAMQQARQRGTQAARPGEAVPAAETAEQRERRQAVDAWLRRVPDEPGGLLKTKFQLEYERRQKEGK
ncbi:MAG: tetratricopeptide repeat protein, partial [Pseudoxanthomonas sp.]